MTPNNQVKIALLTGYLGAGKTTLLNHILSNQQGARIAVIVNDIGEINVDAGLIKQGGFNQVEGSLIPLTNGCICYTLSDDLSRQLEQIANSGDFDYIVIEASGICEPIPIAYTISTFCNQNEYAGGAPLALDNIVAVVDCARLLDEFDGGRSLLASDIDEDDVEALLVQQLEFCSTVILNKTDMVTPEQLSEVKAVVRALQTEAVIVEAVQGDVPLDQLLNTGRFDFRKAYESAAWNDAMEHPEEHEEPETLEYGIETFVYKRRRPFDLEKLSDLFRGLGHEVVRSKGMIWLAQDPDMCYVFEQAGKQISLSQAGLFIHSAPVEERMHLLQANPEFLEDWDPEVGDRLTRLCVIGRKMDRDGLIAQLDGCLVDWAH